MNALIDILRFSAKNPIGETVTSFVGNNNGGISEGIAGNFLLSLPSVARALIERARRKNCNDMGFQRTALSALLHFSYLRDQRTWTVLLLDDGYCQVAFDHLIHTDDFLSCGCCLVTLGNIALESDNNRDRILGEGNAIFDAIHKNFDSTPHRVIWFLYTLFRRLPVPPLDTIRSIWYIVKGSIENTFVGRGEEHEIPEDQIDGTESALVLIFQAIRSTVQETFVSYVNIVCHDNTLMEKLVYFVKHKCTPKGIVDGSMDILRLLSKCPVEIPHLIRSGYITLMLDMCKHSDRDVRKWALFALIPFTRYPDFIPVLLNADSFYSIIFEKISWETGAPKNYAFKLLTEAVRTMVTHGMHPQLDTNKFSPIVHNLCMAFSNVDDVNEPPDMARICNALCALAKTDRYRLRTRIALEDSNAEEHLNLWYARTPDRGLCTQFEFLLNFMDNNDDDEPMDINE